MVIIYPEQCDHKWIDSEGKCYKCKLTREQIKNLKMLKKETRLIHIIPTEWEKELKGTGHDLAQLMNYMLRPIRDYLGNIIDVELVRIHTIKGWYYVDKDVVKETN